MSVVESKISRFWLFLANPMVAKINKIEETGENGEVLKRNSIVLKTLFFILLTAIGVGLFFLIDKIVPTQYVVKISGVKVNIIEACIAFGGLFLGLLGTLISFKFVKSASLFGSIYSLMIGYSLVFASNFAGRSYVIPVLIALGITMLIVLVMSILYGLHIININKKFVSIIVTLIVVEGLLALLVYITSLIPATTKYAKLIMENKILVLTLSMIGIVIASLFLLVDYEIINNSIEKQLPKKYEWLCAYALSFSIIELYIKILNFILRFTQKDGAED